MRQFVTGLLLLSGLLCFSIGQAQVAMETGNVYNKIASIISFSTIPGSSGDDYHEPNVAQLATWESTLTNVLAGNYTEAADSAAMINYQLVQFTDTSFTPSREFYVLENTDTNYWGTYVFYPNSCRPTVIQSPHPRKDANTGLQGIHVFKETASLFYMVSGTHRCNSSQHTSCSGTTSGCSSSSEPYRISDLAHTTNSIYQKTTEILFNTYSNSHFVQLHGFAKLSTDPYVILSNGTQVTPATDYLAAFGSKLHEADTSLTFKVAHVDLGWTRLRGFFNTQGRLINGSPDPCMTNATNSAGRFFHVEQEKTKLRDNATGWDKIAYAVNGAFPGVEGQFTTTSSGLDATFAASSIGFPVQWHWDFGDGQTSSQQNPSHTYAIEGTYTVCLTVSDACTSDTICTDIQIVCPLPQANFSDSIDTLTVHFTNSSSASTSWFWDFGDGGTDTIQNPVHQYLSPGTYTVCLTAADSCGADTTCTDITLDDLDPGTGFGEFANSAVRFYPNPSSGQVYLEVGEDQGTLTVFDLLGNRMVDLSVRAGEHQPIDFSDLPNGHYLLRWSGTGETLTCKLVIVR